MEPQREPGVLGLGLATLMPTNGTQSISVADVDGVKLAGLLIGAAPTIAHVINNTGGPSNSANNVAQWVNYP